MSFKSSCKNITAVLLYRQMEIYGKGGIK